MDARRYRDYLNMRLLVQSSRNRLSESLEFELESIELLGSNIINKLVVWMCARLNSGCVLITFVIIRWFSSRNLPIRLCSVFVNLLTWTASIRTFLISQPNLRLHRTYKNELLSTDNGKASERFVPLSTLKERVIYSVNHSKSCQLTSRHCGKRNNFN